MNDIPSRYIGMLRGMCEASHLAFFRYFFRVREQAPAHINWHHRLICDAIDKIIQEASGNLLINVAPGSGKTELCVINLLARGLALNPDARFLHLSYSRELAIENAAKSKEIIEGDECSRLWGFSLRQDMRSKGRWNVARGDYRGGGVYAASTFGQVTGFRAGHLRHGFQGIIVIDDPLKPEDIYSTTYRQRANRVLLSTIRSRKASPDTPIILIMQRLHAEDCSDFVLSGGLPGAWRHINIPAIIDDDYVSETIPSQYHDSVDSSIRDTRGRFSYWEKKERLDELLSLEAGTLSDATGRNISRGVFSAQYMQSPIADDGGAWRVAWFGRFDSPGYYPRIVQSWDTATKPGQLNDYSVGLTLGIADKIDILDCYREKPGYPALVRQIKAYAERWNPNAILIEDAGNGAAAIQQLYAETSLPIIPVTPDGPKPLRMSQCSGVIEAGGVRLPVSAPWLVAFESEISQVPGGTHDDQADALSQALNWLHHSAMRIQGSGAGGAASSLTSRYRAR